jgi:sugar transferase (PEP-CTERM/EpsH1 system associated)
MIAMHEPIKIVHVVHALAVGGLENGVVNLINHLDDRFEHTVLCLSKSGPMAQRLESRNVAVVELGLPTDKFRFPILKLSRVLRRISPDIVHTRGWSSVDAISAARVAQVPCVIHGEHGWEASDPEGRNRKRIFIRKCLSPLVDRFVTVSEDLKRWLSQTVGISARKITRIHNGVDIQRFSTGEREQARKLLGLDDSVFTIGTVGRLDPVKDHESLLKAFAPIARSESPACLLIAGDGPMRGEIQAMAVRLGIADKVKLLGERQDVPMVLKAFDVFTLTSIAEGISNTILEAMASGLPVVATRVGGNPELVEHGVTGQMTAARDVTALTDALRNYLYNPELRRGHGLNAWARAKQSFSLERMAAQYTDLYLGLTDRRAEKVA